MDTKEGDRSHKSSPTYDALHPKVIIHAPHEGDKDELDKRVERELELQRMLHITERIPKIKFRLKSQNAS